MRWHLVDYLLRQDVQQASQVHAQKPRPGTEEGNYLPDLSPACAYHHDDSKLGHRDRRVEAP